MALGILIDNSGSMLPKRAKVNEAALQLVGASQQEDRVFVVNFGDGAYLDQDYTPDVGKLRAALQHVETRGSTALYDAVIAAADHLNQTSPLQKRILLVVTDGRDNASEATFQDVLRRLQSKNGPVVYVIALDQHDNDRRGNDRRDNDRRDNDRRGNDDRQSLRMLSEQTGGTAFFPSSLDEVQSIASTISRRHSKSVRDRLPLFESSHSRQLPLDSGSCVRGIHSTACRDPHRVLFGRHRKR